MRFKLGKRVVRFTRCFFRRFRTRPVYVRLNSSPEKTNNNMKKKLLTWSQKLTTKAKSLCLKKTSGYLPVGSDPVQGSGSSSTVPKGYLAVYVGQKDGEFRRVLVPVVYFNHPLFGELLKEAEKEYGFYHQGGITIPCRVNEFERVRTRIESGSSVRKFTQLKLR